MAKEINVTKVMDVLKFIALVIKYRRTRLIDPEEGEKLGAKIDEACTAYLDTGFIDEKGN